MIRGLLVVATAGAVGFAVTSVVFSFVLPLVFLALKVAFFCMIVYLVLRMVKPDLAQDLKERCCGTK
ncbi:MAG: hypothetical protein OEU54_09815 [Gemmatimonadota bacterium]|nr:hypothetical protein [Gemmatimonadota bacterium]